MRKVTLALALVAIVAPVAAPAQFSDSYNFLKAVRERDGQKVTDFINKPGSGAVIVNTRDSSTGDGALHIVTKRRDVTWLSFLLAKGANPDMRDAGGNTALMLAAQIGFAEGLSLLIDRRAQVDLANSRGETPLMRAVQNRDIATVRTLLTAGANPNKADTSSGMTARQYAERDARSAAIVKAMDEAKPKPKVKVGPN
jgi:ankyrin repeat protein